MIIIIQENYTGCKHVNVGVIVIQACYTEAILQVLQGMSLQYMYYN